MELSVEKKKRMDKIAVRMNLEPIGLLTNEKGTDFLFGYKNLCLASIHPFDLEKSNLPEYKQLIELVDTSVRFVPPISGVIGSSSYLGKSMH